jgi:hypothetical protein
VSNGRNATTAQNGRKTLNLDAVYDIESERDWGGFLVGGILDVDGTYTEGTWEEEEDFAQTIIETRGDVWAHAGGSYDHKWLLQSTKDDGMRWDISVAGSRIISARRGSLRLLDSNALVKISLRDFTRGLGIEKSSHGLICQTPEVCGVDCGGFCRFHRKMPRQEFERVREYLRADCESLLGAMERLSSYGEEHDIDLASTVGGSSWACAKRWCDLPDAELSLDDHLFARKGYYGGRVQIFRPEALEGNRYDINSSYPYALSMLELPWGHPYRRCGEYASAEFDKGREGFVAARVSVPEMWIPPLPVRLRDRIAYPTGEIEGVWTCSELRNAVSLGVTVLDVSEGLFWPETRRVFESWVAKLWELRKTDRHGKSGPLGTFLKFYLNSLTGKLGMRPQSKQYILNPQLPRMNWEEIGSGVWSYDGPTVQVRNGKWVAGNPCCHVEWSSYITAFGRIRWLQQAIAGETVGRDMVMGDTDSVFVTGIRTQELGNELGQWQHEGTFSRFQAIAPKFYRFVSQSQDMGDKVIVKSKGVGKRATEEFGELFGSGKQNFRTRGMAGFRWASRHGNLFQRSEESKTIVQGFGDRIFDARAGITNPPRMRDIIK